MLHKTFAEQQIEAVIHFAAFAYVGESVREPRKYFQNNVANTRGRLDEMLDAGVRRIVFSSTCATYGLPITLPLDEMHSQRPVSPYGESKLFVERVLQAYDRAYGLRSVALRYFNAAGADPEAHLIPLVIEAALGHRPCIAIYGCDYQTPDGTAIRDLSTSWT